jgi:membrane-bound lytic murein transglycosylase B
LTLWPDFDKNIKTVKGGGSLKKTLIVLAIVTITFFCPFPCGAQIKMEFASAEDTRLLYDKIIARGFSQSEINAIFTDERRTLEWDIFKPSKKRNYADVFYQVSVERGRKCLASNNIFFSRLEQIFGVPREVLVSIYRVETDLGKNLGKYQVTNSLFTLWFVRNRRSEYFGGELVNWLSICKNHGYDYYSTPSSSAGAFGHMQFMPTSFLEYAIDGNGDGKIDLLVFEDAMASAANYLRGKGWRNGSQTGNEKVILRYNSDGDYKDAVIRYARKLRI